MNYKKIIAQISEDRGIKYSSIRKLPHFLYAAIDDDKNIIEIYQVIGTFVHVVQNISSSSRMNAIYFLGIFKFSSFRSLCYRSKYLKIEPSNLLYWSIFDYEN